MDPGEFRGEGFAIQVFHQRMFQDDKHQMGQHLDGHFGSHREEGVEEEDAVIGALDHFFRPAKDRADG